MLVWKRWNRLTESCRKSQGFMLDHHLTCLTYIKRSDVWTNLKCNYRPTWWKRQRLSALCRLPLQKGVWILTGQIVLISSTFSAHTGLDEKQCVVAATTAAWVYYCFLFFCFLLDSRGFLFISICFYLSSHLFAVVSMFSAELACRRDLANFLLKGIMSKVRSFRDFPTPKLHCRLNWGFLGE